MLLVRLSSFPGVALRTEGFGSAAHFTSVGSFVRAKACGAAGNVVVGESVVSSRNKLLHSDAVSWRRFCEKTRNNGANLLRR